MNWHGHDAWKTLGSEVAVHVACAFCLFFYFSFSFCGSKFEIFVERNSEMINQVGSQGACVQNELSSTAVD